MYVRDKYSQDDSVYSVVQTRESVWSRQLKRVFKEKKIVPTYTFNLNQIAQFKVESIIPATTKDSIAIIHWIDGFLSVQTIRLLADAFNGSIAWVIHDLEPFTGGCHYSFKCTGYLDTCGSCPQLCSVDKHDLSHQLWKQKRSLLAPYPIHFIATTSWGEKRLRESSIFSTHKVSRIPLPIDTNIYHPHSMIQAREILQLPPHAKILLCGASYLDDPRKGFSELSQSLLTLDKSSLDNLILVVVGLNDNESFRKIPIPVKSLGEISNQQTMALVYQSADIFLCPSLEESGPMMIPEAMLCGTPVVAFDTGGAPDWIDHRRNGYLARMSDIQDFAEGIDTILKMDRSPLTIAARRKAEVLHQPDTVARQHRQLYQQVLHSHAARN